MGGELIGLCRLMGESTSGLIDKDKKSLSTSTKSFENWFGDASQ